MFVITLVQGASEPATPRSTPATNAAQKYDG